VDRDISTIRGMGLIINCETRCYTCETVFPFLVKYFFYLFIYIIS
jgi:hypothetical protein